MSEVPAVPCIRCGGPATTSIEGGPACEHCAEDWRLFKEGLDIARRLGATGVRLPSGRVYRPKGGR